MATSLASDPRTFAPLAPDAVIPAGTVVTIEDLFVYTLGAAEHVGTYLIFAEGRGHARLDRLMRDGASTTDASIREISWPWPGRPSP